LRISGSTLRSRTLVDKAVVAGAVEHHVVPLLQARRVRVLLEATFPLDRAVEAYERFAQGGKLGKIVLVPPRP
jgi:NADPH:quinone reductase-like Zn-dependent oxidoreductase